MTESLLHRNEVALTGRVSGEPQHRVLPSGDELVSFRLVVRRPASARRRSRQVVDTIECVAWTSRLRRRVARLVDGDEVAVTGALRRRFQRGSGAAQSWYAVELATCGPADVPQ